MARPQTHMPFEGTPLSRAIEEVETRLRQANEEISGLTNNLLSERSLRESTERERDEYKSQVEGLQARVDFFRDRSIMAISLAAGLVATVRGFIPEAGKQVLSIFKTLNTTIDKQIKDLDELVKDHLAGAKDLADSQRQARKDKAADDAKVEEAARNIGAPNDGPVITKTRSFEQMEAELAELLNFRPKTEPLGEPHISIRGDLGEVAGRVLAREGGEEVPVPENDAGKLLEPERKSILSRVSDAMRNR